MVVMPAKKLLLLAVWLPFWKLSSSCAVRQVKSEKKSVALVREGMAVAMMRREVTTRKTVGQMSYWLE